LVGGRRTRCSVEGCGELIARVPFCLAHAVRFEKTGDPLGEVAHDKCAATCCDRLAVVMGLCPGHYARKKVGLEVDVPLQKRRNRKPEKPCTVGGCPMLGRTRGMCATHYMRWLKHGDPLRGHLPSRTGGKKKQGYVEVYDVSAGRYRPGDTGRSTGW
jgi:hypothetical protein